MKNLKFLFPAIVLFSLISCSDKKIVQDDSVVVETLKSVVDKKDQNETWTKEIESDRLTASFDSDESIIAKGVQKEPPSFTVLKNTQPLYPTYENFLNLDISVLDKSTVKNIQSFCSDILSFNSKNFSSYFNEKYIFNAVFFNKDFVDGWKSNFDEVLKVNSNEDSVQKLFNSYVIGKPELYSDDSVIQVPVLFISEQYKLYLNIVLDPKVQNSFYQINISKWELLDAE